MYNFDSYRLTIVERNLMIEKEEVMYVFINIDQGILC